MASSSSAWRDGWRRVRAAPAIAVGVFVFTVAAALPLAIVLRGQLEAHLGRSLAANAAADGVNYDWWQEFTAQATGLGTTFTPSVIGFAAVLDNVSSVLDARAEIAPIAGALALYLTGWTFVSGGILDRYARQRATRAHGFFAASGVHFFRFLRLGACAAVAYWWLFTSLHPWLFGDRYTALTSGTSVERVALAWRLLFYLLFGGLLILVNVIVDYARIRLVVEDRHSAVGALVAAMRFIRWNARAVAGLYLANSLTWLALLAVWALIAPGVRGSGAGMWAAFVLGQAYIAARLLVKLQFMASQTSLFQSRLAHASYVAASPAAWPESPAAETIRP